MVKKFSQHRRRLAPLDASGSVRERERERERE
jgi:hypothetical protein